MEPDPRRPLAGGARGGAHQERRLRRLHWAGGLQPLAERGGAGRDRAPRRRKPGRVPGHPGLAAGGVAPGEEELPRFLLRTTWVKFSRTLDDGEAFHNLVCGIRGIAPGPGPGQAIFEGECPYRGLEVFEEKHARFFFGREAQVDWLLSHRLAPMAESSHATRFLSILGPSGSGKSSLALAGLIPALRAGKVEGSAGWPIVVFRPGSNPLESLAIELSCVGGSESSAAGDPGPDLRTWRKDRTTLHLTAHLALARHPPRGWWSWPTSSKRSSLSAPMSALRRALIENLLHAATVVGGPVLVLLTMRVDFLGKCAAYPDLAAALSDGQELVGPMSEDELRLAIERPAELVGCDPGAGPDRPALARCAGPGRGPAAPGVHAAGALASARWATA